jgi:polyferredoxin
VFFDFIEGTGEFLFSESKLKLRRMLCLLLLRGVIRALLLRGARSKLIFFFLRTLKSLLALKLVVLNGTGFGIVLQSTSS